MNDANRRIARQAVARLAVAFVASVATFVGVYVWAVDRLGPDDAIWTGFLVLVGTAIWSYASGPWIASLVGRAARGPGTGHPIEAQRVPGSLRR
jgi:hypothetical protein